MWLVANIPVYSLLWFCCCCGAVPRICMISLDHPVVLVEVNNVVKPSVSNVTITQMSWMPNVGLMSYIVFSCAGSRVAHMPVL